MYNDFNDYRETEDAKQKQPRTRENYKKGLIKNHQPILYLPKFSYFGDYQILHNLKSNLNYYTMSENDNPS